MRDTIYGFRAIAARNEVMDIEDEVDRLIRRRGRCAYGSPRWQGLTARIDAAIKGIDDIERRYFDAPDTALRAWFRRVGARLARLLRLGRTATQRGGD